MAAIKNQELDLANLEDLEHLKQLVLKRSQNSREIRHASHIIRRLLIDGNLAKSTSPRGIKLIFFAPDNKPLIQIASYKTVVFWLSGGCNVFGTMLRGILIALDEGPPHTNLMASPQSI